MAYISSGYGSDTTSNADHYDPDSRDHASGGVLVVDTCDCDTEATTTGHPMSDTVIWHELRCCVMDWDYRDFIEPDLPDHEPAPRAIRPIKSAPRITTHIIKQPGKFRRGNRI